MDLAQKWEATSLLYGGKCKTFARNSYRQLPGFDQEDVEQELLIVLWECVTSYDPNRGATFNTFFQQSAKNRVITMIRRANTQSRRAFTVSLAEEAVSAAVDEFLAVHSAEDLALMRIEIAGQVAEHGAEVLSGGRSSRTKVA